MNQEQRVKLKELAERAIPGPWVVEYEVNYGEAEVYGIRTESGVSVVETDAGYYSPKAPEAEYIAAAHPQVVLELLDTIERCERAFKEMMPGVSSVEEACVQINYFLNKNKTPHA